MTEALRQYRHRRGSTASVLPALLERLRSDGALDEGAVVKLSGRLGLPPAAIRAAASYYADLHSDPEAVRVCRGTSCMLAGAEGVHAALEVSSPCQSVYCLGYCDRSPAVLRADERVALGINEEDLSRVSPSATPSSPPLPSIRCAASRSVVTRRLIKGSHASLARARASGAYEALAQALDVEPGEVISRVERSGELGRGGAAYPTGAKWRTCAETPSDCRFVIANGDEGDPGSFIDRVLMEEDPHSVVEGMTIAGWAVGAAEGIIFIRSEYPRAMNQMRRALEDARNAGLLGRNILDRGFDFDITIFPAMGSYVCGEETAMLNAIEGFRGEVSLRPPYPAVEGLHGCPTVVDNVETLSNIPVIVRNGGAEMYRKLGTDASSGTKAMCLNHGFAKPGVVEIEFGLTLRQLIEEHGGGGAHGRKIEAVILGGPMGSFVTPDRWDVPICYAAMREAGIELGHGGLVALPEGTDYGMLLRHWLGFMKDESCGKCVPCRLGSEKAWELAGHPQRQGVREDLEALFDIITAGSLCAFGRRIPRPVQELIDAFGDRIFTSAGKGSGA